MIRQLVLSTLLCCIIFSASSQKAPDLALTPPMGWNSWNTFADHINEQMAMQMADAIVSSGMKDAGYIYLVLDDAWMAKDRDSSGSLVADPKKFPHGMRALSDYVHSKGLKFGLYNCAGRLTCAGYPGTRGHEYEDARFYASMGVDYLKFDWCYTEGINQQEAYHTMSQALAATHRPIVFSLCEWGSSKPWLWAEPVGHLWRTTGDIGNQFEGVKPIGNWKANGVMLIVDMQDTLRRYAGPGHWNDPDMLEVGNGLTTGQDRAHFSMWCMLAAPLIAGNDLRSMTAQTKEILTNKEVIAINQDSLGVQALKFSAKDSLETWFKPLVNGEWAIAFLNRSTQPRTIPATWAKMVVNDTLSKKTFDATTQVYKVHDVWMHKDIGTTKRAPALQVAAQDVVVLRLRK